MKQGTLSNWAKTFDREEEKKKLSENGLYLGTLVKEYKNITGRHFPKGDPAKDEEFVAIALKQNPEDPKAGQFMDKSLFANDAFRKFFDNDKVYCKIHLIVINKYFEQFSQRIGDNMVDDYNLWSKILKETECVKELKYICQLAEYAAHTLQSTEATIRLMQLAMGQAEHIQNYGSFLIFSNLAKEARYWYKKTIDLLESLYVNNEKGIYANEVYSVSHRLRWNLSSQKLSDEEFLKRKKRYIELGGPYLGARNVYPNGSLQNICWINWVKLDRLLDFSDGDLQKNIFVNVQMEKFTLNNTNINKTMFFGMPDAIQSLMKYLKTNNKEMSIFIDTKTLQKAPQEIKNKGRSRAFFELQWKNGKLHIYTRTRKYMCIEIEKRDMTDKNKKIMKAEVYKLEGPSKPSEKFLGAAAPLPKSNNEEDILKIFWEITKSSKPKNLDEFEVKLDDGTLIPVEFHGFGKPTFIKQDYIDIKFTHLK